MTQTNASNHPPTELRDKFVNVFETLQEADPTLILVPHESINHSEGAMVKPNFMPNEPTQIKKCLDNVMPNEKGGNAHSQVLIAHNQSFSDTCEDCQCKLKAGGHKIHRRQLPVEKMDSVGCFLFSVRTQDVEDLKNMFWEN